MDSKIVIVSQWLL